MALVRAYTTMLPRLKAEESMDRVQSTALGTGSLERGEARRISNALRRQAHPPGSGRRRVAKADPRALAMMGIAVIEEGASSPAEEAPNDG